MPLSACAAAPPVLLPSLQAWQAADLGGDDRLDQREFCLFVQLLRGAQKGWPLPARLSEGEAAALLGEAPMPAAPAQPPQLHIDAAHMRSVLHGQGPAHSRQGSLERQQSVIQAGAGCPGGGSTHSRPACWYRGASCCACSWLPRAPACSAPRAPSCSCPALATARHVRATALQDDSDGASSIDSGIAESVSGMSVCSRPAAAARVPGGPFALGRPSATPHRTGLGSVLGGGHGASATAGAYLPAAATGSAIARLVPYGSDADVAHNLLELTVHSAQVGGQLLRFGQRMPAGLCQMR